MKLNLFILLLVYLIFSSFLIDVYISKNFVYKTLNYYASIAKKNYIKSENLKEEVVKGSVFKEEKYAIYYFRISNTKLDILNGSNLLERSFKINAKKKLPAGDQEFTRYEFKDSKGKDGHLDIYTPFEQEYVHYLNFRYKRESTTYFSNESFRSD